MTGGKCPYSSDRIGGAEGSKPLIQDWYPQYLRVEVLDEPSPYSNPYNKDFDYEAEFNSINFKELKADISKLLKSSQSWWPADYGDYGPFMVRTAWHNAGTYRIADGRGGLGHALQRFLPISSWVDNGNTDKMRRLLWPVKQKYGDKIGWADLFALAGNVALENMGVKTVGYGAGRTDAWNNDNKTFWGQETEMLGRLRWSGAPEHGTVKSPTAPGDLENPLADSEYGLIYVNPEGPGGNPDTYLSAKEIRLTFSRMAMSDEDTVALIAGGHSFGKSHGAVPPKYIGGPPEEAGLEHQGLGWINSYKTGNAQHTTTSGIEGAWTQNPTAWNLEYVKNLLDLQWKLVESPAGAKQWTTVDSDETTPDAHIPGQRNQLMMMTSDIALKNDPAYNKILRKFRDSDESVFFEAFAEAWYKLLHRDMGPKSRLWGPEVPKKEYIWQDPIPELNHKVVGKKEIALLKKEIIDAASGLERNAFARVAWASASTHRTSDKRGGANGARIRLQPQIDWKVNRPVELKAVLERLAKIQSKFNAANKASNVQISLADLIVLAGAVDVEIAAKEGGFKVEVPFTPGRMDASVEQTNVEAFEWLEPAIDGFRNYEPRDFSVSPEQLLIDRAQLLGLTSPELTVLFGGFRVLNLNWNGSAIGILTDRPGVLTNDFFVNLLDTNSTRWESVDDSKKRFVAIDRSTGDSKWTAGRTELIFGFHNQLRSISEVYGATTAQSKQRFVNDFVAAWDKVMMLDRFDLKHVTSHVS